MTKSANVRLIIMIRLMAHEDIRHGFLRWAEEIKLLPLAMLVESSSSVFVSTGKCACTYCCAGYYSTSKQCSLREKYSSSEMVAFEATGSEESVFKGSTIYRKKK